MTDANLIENFCIPDEIRKSFVPKLKNIRWTHPAKVAVIIRV